MALRLPGFKWPLQQRDWELIYRKLTEAAALIWNQIDKTGSSLADLASRKHEQLTDILGWTSGTNATKDKHISQADGKVWQDHSTLSSHTHHGFDHDATYAPIAKGVTNGDSHDHSGGDGAQIDHGGLAGLGDDDHSQYHTDARGDIRYPQKAHDHTTADATGPLTNDEHDGFVEIATSATPSTPASGKMRIYAQDASGVARLRALHSTGSDLAFFRDSVVRVKNTSGGTINKGELAYVTGATGNFPTIAKAKADAAATMPVAGMVLATAANNVFTTLQFAGEMTGLDTSAFAEGAIVFASATTAGGLIDTEPQHPYLSQPIGVVTKANAGDGRIQLFVSLGHEGDSYGSTRSPFKVGPGSGASAVDLVFANSNTGTLRWTPTGSRTLTLPDTTDTLATGTSGTYTPTLTNVANLDASTAYQCQWLRVNNSVTVSGRVDIDPTLTATTTQLGISLPVASDLTAAQNCAGSAFSSSIAGQGAAILGDATNNRAEMKWKAADITNQDMYFSFTYLVQ